MSLLQDLGGVADPECSDNSNEGSMQVSQSIKAEKSSKLTGNSKRMHTKA